MLRSTLFLILLMVSLIGFFWGLSIPLETVLEWFRVLKASHSAVPIYFAVSLIICLVNLPLGAITKAMGGWLFGINLGFWYSYIFILFCSWIAFLWSRYLGRDFILKKWPNAIRKVNAHIENNEFLSLISLRIYPFVPLPAVNLTLGLTQISNSKFLLTSAIGMIPATVFYSYLGAGLKDLTVETVNFQHFTSYYFYIGSATIVSMSLFFWKRSTPKKN